jgi:Skp family chaperone for outer membrane proteins
MMKHFFCIVVLFFAIFASAQEQKQIVTQEQIAVLDMDRIFNEYHKKKIADIELKRQAEVYKKYAEDLGVSLGKLQEEFKQLRDDSLNIALSDVERESKRFAAQDKYRQMKEKEGELKNYSLEKQDNIKNKYEEIKEKLLNEIKAVIAKIAKGNGYSVVLDSSGRTMNQIPSLVYYVKELDITEAVLRELNPMEPVSGLTQETK